MAHMKRYAAAITSLRECSQAITEIADDLEALLSGTPEKTEAPEPKAKPAIKLEDVRAVLAQKSREGLTDQVRALIERYGADRLSAVDPANYAAILKDAEVLHAE
ncbi:rRNA biogenesis protein rrp5 [Alloscardovia omnicolens]|uniref:rRNA biogenesis protein rrp5 n=1 Tax=Alloscardovia omnicolens TaxID=419015 RepID=UPI003A62B876